MHHRETPMISDILQEKIHKLPGPILILGASGFVGANLFHTIFAVRNDVFGVSTSPRPWRLANVPNEQIIVSDLLIGSNLILLLDTVRPQIIFDCIAYGAYPFEVQEERIYQTNFNLVIRILLELKNRRIHRYVHSGSSSEYGSHGAAPDEDSPCWPNSHYAVSKVAAANAIFFMGQHHALPCVNLRFYSIYGPWEDPSRLIPTLISKGIKGELPPFVHPDISRDFIYIDDACEAFFDAALNLETSHYGHSFNIGSGRCTTIREVADLSKKLFDINDMPHFSMPNRSWDITDWYANPSRAKEVLKWSSRISFEEGLKRTIAWYRQLPEEKIHPQSSKNREADPFSVSVIVACYKDAQAIPHMYKRLTDVFQKIGSDYEIIFVNDCSPDHCEEVIREISQRDFRVTGISHSRNFGSQAAFRSGMEMARKNACVLMDGDLQDPPELIEQFVEKWREGYDVVYGRRVKRVAPWYMQIAYKVFYRVFAHFSYMKIPHDAGDFSLIDRRVVTAMLRFQERDLFLRGVRAFVGFRQIGVDHTRPERMFGRTTNNFFANMEWAKKGLISFSNFPLSLLSSISWSLFFFVILLIIYQVSSKLFFGNSTPRGITTLMLLILFFGSATLLAVSLVGEYVSKIFNESKQRPLFIRSALIRRGEVCTLDPPASAGTMINELR